MSRDAPRTEYTGDDARDETGRPATERSRFRDFVPFGWPTALAPGAEDETSPEERGHVERSRDEYRETDRRENEDGRWLDRGLIAATILVGVVLLLFPEPATSALGMALVAAGVIAWLVEWLR